jgi:tRNA-Thr(GGU) m(6)t(6)A37 methyltransferase TsaA
MEVEAIGHVETARQSAEDDYWGGVESCIVLGDRLGSDALVGLEQFSHVEVLFFFDRVEAEKIVWGKRHPRNNEEWPAVGIFAQRGKNRPNRIGSTIARIVRREGRRLYVSELDAIDGTPVLDIKPVMQEFLPRGKIRQPEWSRQLMRRYWERQA